MVTLAHTSAACAQNRRMHPSLSSAVRSGDVAWSRTVAPTDLPEIASHCLVAWSATGQIGASSVANWGGLRNGTGAPAARAAWAMSGSSVLTRKSSKSRLRLAASMLYEINGRPPNKLRFLPGNRLDPPRATTTPRLTGRSGSIGSCRSAVRISVGPVDSRDQFHGLERFVQRDTPRSPPHSGRGGVLGLKAQAGFEAVIPGRSLHPL